MTRPSRALAALVMVLGAAACGSTAPPGHSPQVEALFGTPAAYRIVAGPNAGAITAYKIDSLKGATGDAGNGEIAGYAILGETVDVPDAVAARLARILGDAATYDFERQKGCKFTPGVAMRWERRRTTVDVLFCFDCDELQVFLDGEAVGYEDFDARRSDLLGIVKGLFPADPEIQGIGTSRD